MSFPENTDLAVEAPASCTPFSHRGYVMVRGDEWDGDGFSTPAYFAVPEGGGPSEMLYHPRFDFEPTAEWFRGAVEAMLERKAWFAAQRERTA